MPQITINEYDYTGIPAGYSASNTVFIPGPLGSDINLGSSDFSKPVLCRTLDEFEERFGSRITEETSNFESWIMAHQLVKLGLPVLYWGNVDVTQIGMPEYVYNEVKDKALYDIRFITAGAIGLGSYLSGEESGGSAFDYIELAQQMIDSAYQRGDAIALLSPVKDISSPEAVFALAQEIQEKGSWTKVRDPYDPEAGNVDSDEKAALKFASMFSPSCKFASIAKNESLTSSSAILPGIFTYLSAYARSISKNATWFAAAGSFRGISPFKYEPVVAYGEAAINALQTRKEGDSCVNTIAEIRPFGNLVWGNRTMLPNVNWETVADGGLKASHFLNIRHLCCELHKTLYRASRKYTFEQNDDILWANYQAEIKPLLDKMKSGRGIRGYRIIKVASNRKAVLKAKIRINPIEAVEDFYIDIELTDNLDVSVDVE
jgi:hypothetical protein